MACCLITDKYAWASIDKVMCRYQPSHRRTSYWSSPTPAFAGQALSLDLLKAFLYRPPRSGHPRQLLRAVPTGPNTPNTLTPQAWQCCAGPAVSSPCRLFQRPYINVGPVVDPGPLGPFARAAPDPSRFVDLRRQTVSPHLKRSLGCPSPQLLIAFDGRHMGNSL